MKIVYVHHAMREMNNTPNQNDSISALGLEDAMITGESLKALSNYPQINYKAIYTSPNLRCMKTAEIINKWLEIPIYQDSRLNEFKNMSNEITQEEAWIKFQLTIRDVLKDIVNKFDESDTVVCVTSGVNISAFIGLAYNIPAKRNTPFPIVVGCSPICFEISRKHFK